MFDTRNTAPLMLDPSAQCSGCPGDGALFPLFLDQTEAGRAEKFFFKTGPFFSQGLDDPHPPPRLSEGLDPPLQCLSKKVSQTHQDLEKDLCSFFLALSRWRERVGNLSNDDSNVNEKGKKSNRFRLAKQQPCT